MTPRDLYYLIGDIVIRNTGSKDIWQPGPVTVEQRAAVRAEILSALHKMDVAEAAVEAQR